MKSTILKRPIITEKSIDRTRNKFFTFEVSKNASKHQVKQAVEDLFSVTVFLVRIVNRDGKVKRVGRQRTEKQSTGKKYALVKIGPDQTIDLFSVAPEQTQ